MNRIYSSIVGLLAASLLALSGSGCSSSDGSDGDVADNSLTTDNIIGTWVITQINGETLCTNEYFAFRFNSNGVEDYLALVSDGDGSAMLSYTDNTMYRVEDSTIYLISDIVELEFPASISYGATAADDILTYTESVNIQEGVDQNDSRSFTAYRCMADYADEIVGMWEGVVIEGDDSEPFDNIRLDFKSGGTYDFYKLDGEEWLLLEQGNIYAILGSLLASQWDDGSGTISAEIWETSIEGDTMTWRATREGLANEVGFDLVRVAE